MTCDDHSVVYGWDMEIHDDSKIQARPMLMTTGEVAYELRVSAATVKRWTSAGMLCPVRLGGYSVRYRREDVERFASGRES